MNNNKASQENTQKTIQQMPKSLDINSTKHIHKLNYLKLEHLIDLTYAINT